MSKKVKFEKKHVQLALVKEAPRLKKMSLLPMISTALGHMIRLYAGGLLELVSLIDSPVISSLSARILS